MLGMFFERDHAHFFQIFIHPSRVHSSLSMLMKGERTTNNKKNMVNPIFWHDWGP
jgi:hypothetical protein